MEATSIGVAGEAHQFLYGGGGVERRCLEWDPDLWKWDGDLFIATPIHPNSAPALSNSQFFPLQNQVPMAASNTSSSCSDELSLAIQKETTERNLQDRKRSQDDSLQDESAILLSSLVDMGIPRQPAIAKRPLERSPRPVELLLIGPSVRLWIVELISVRPKTITGDIRFVRCIPRPLRHLLPIFCSVSANNAADFTRFKSLMKGKEAVADV